MKSREEALVWDDLKLYLCISSNLFFFHTENVYWSGNKYAFIYFFIYFFMSSALEVFKGTVLRDRFRKCWRKWTDLGPNKGRVWFLNFLEAPLIFNWNKTSFFPVNAKITPIAYVVRLILSLNSRQAYWIWILVMSAFSKENWGLKLSLRCRQIVIAH
jgi:hypothetical protein